MRVEPNLQTLLVPVDYSDPSRLAVKHAVTLSRRFGAKLVLLFAWAAPYADLALAKRAETAHEQTLFDLVRRECEDAMDEFLHELRAQESDLAVSSLVVSGDPSKAIVEQAALLHADLIVMGTHGRGGAARWLLGSVAEAVLRRAECPVLVVPTRADA
jgi:universal stress protein A